MDEPVPIIVAPTVQKIRKNPRFEPPVRKFEPPVFPLVMSEEAQYYYGGKKIVRQVMGFMMFVIEIIWLGNHMNGGSKYFFPRRNNTAPLLTL